MDDQGPQRDDTLGSPRTICVVPHCDDLVDAPRHQRWARRRRPRQAALQPPHPRPDHPPRGPLHHHRTWPTL